MLKKNKLHEHDLLSHAEALNYCVLNNQPNCSTLYGCLRFHYQIV